MHVYRIKHTYSDEHARQIIAVDSQGGTHNISLDKNKRTEKFVRGKRIIVLRDKYLDIEDVAYICGGQLYLCRYPCITDKYGCDCLVDYVGGMGQEYKLDRFVFKAAIARACLDNDIPISLRANKNLLNLLASAKGY